MSNPQIIKVCGMREAENIREVDQLSIIRLDFGQKMKPIQLIDN